MKNQVTETGSEQRQAAVNDNLKTLLNLPEHQAANKSIDELLNKQTQDYIHNSVIRFTDDIDPLALTAGQINDILVNFTGDNYGI